MFVLKKLFELREKTHKDAEKPFLDHLEDLRVVITRVVLTLVIAMGVCFTFRNELMEVIRDPVEQVWQKSQNGKMPDKEQVPVELDLDTWELAKRAARDTARFSPEQKDYYFQFQDPDGTKNLRFHTDCVIYYRAAIDMENTTANGVGFIEQLPGIDDAKRQQIKALLDPEKRPDAAVDSRGKLVLMQALNPTEGFMLSMKLSLFAGIVLAFPLLLFFILQFILPGLKANEKKALWPAMAIGFGLFLGGVLFSYFFVLPKVLDFFYNWSQDMGVQNEWRIGYYISFATQFTLIFGLSFELPVVVMTMVKLGILNYEMMRNTRSYAILAIVITAAVITPTPDAFTLLLLAGPMIVLYEICIWLAFFHNRKAREAELSEEAELRSKMAAPPAFTASRDDDEDDDPGAPPTGGGSSTGAAVAAGFPQVDRDEYFVGSNYDDINKHAQSDADLHSVDDLEGIDHDDHDDHEGNEEDDGVYDFTDEELREEYSHDHRPTDSYEIEEDDSLQEADFILDDEDDVESLIKKSEPATDHSKKDAPDNTSSPQD